MHRVEDADTDFSRRFKNLQHMKNALVAFGDALDSIPFRESESTPTSSLLKPNFWA